MGTQNFMAESGGCQEIYKIFGAILSTLAVPSPGHLMRMRLAQRDKFAIANQLTRRCDIRCQPPRQHILPQDMQSHRHSVQCRQPGAAHQRAQYTILQQNQRITGEHQRRQRSEIDAPCADRVKVCNIAEPPVLKGQNDVARIQTRAQRIGRQHIGRNNPADVATQPAFGQRRSAQIDLLNIIQCHHAKRSNIIARQNSRRLLVRQQLENRIADKNTAISSQNAEAASSASSPSRPALVVWGIG